MPVNRDLSHAVYCFVRQTTAMLFVLVYYAIKRKPSIPALKLKCIMMRYRRSLGYHVTTKLFEIKLSTTYTTNQNNVELLSLDFIFYPIYIYT